MTQRGRVLFVGNFLSRSGGSRDYCEDFTDRLETRGWTVIRVSQHLSRVRRLFDMMMTAITERSDYDVAHVSVYSGPAFLWAEAAAYTLKALGKRFVLSLHGGNLPAFARQHPRRMRRLLATADAVTAPSEYLRQSLGDMRADTIVLPNGLDVNAYGRPAEPHQGQIVWLRAFHEIYNPLLAVEVMQHLLVRHPEALLTMVGPDKFDGSRERVLQRIDELGLGSRIQVMGAIEKRRVPEILSQAAVFLNTARVDNTPVSILEAAAARLAIVSTDVGGIPYLLSQGSTALLVSSDDAAAMADAVVRILSDPELAARLGNAGRELAARHDWTRVLDRWDELFNRVRGLA